jgi:aspartate racemase
MSWQSSAEYYRILNELTQQRRAGLHSARCLMYSVDFANIEAMQAQGRWEDAGAVLSEAARALEAGGADFIVLCTNTMHRVADQIEASVQIPLLHLGDSTAAAVKERGIETIGLLGTRFTMAEPFYRDRLASHGLQVVLPSPADQLLVNDIIYNELCLGDIRPKSREVYRTVMGKLVDEGAQGVIFGCTEIELLVDQSDCAVPVFPTTRLHCEAAADRALGMGGVRRPTLP